MSLEDEVQCLVDAGVTATPASVRALTEGPQSLAAPSATSSCRCSLPTDSRSCALPARSTRSRHIVHGLGSERAASWRPSLIVSPLLGG
jgi:hypothetical protein